ncbi:MAG: hypothetical protein LBI67_11835, partial [Treponema sp.]|nr:hypothetical protein [Treponema sp.]
MKILAIGISIFFISFNLFAIDTRLIGTWINENKRPVIVFTEEKGFIYSEIIDDEINEFLGGNYKTPYELYLN